MPGMNQTGPMNQGPMTGKGLGICRMRGQAGGRGRRGCRGYGPGFGPDAETIDQETLRTRARILEAELAAVKAQMTAEED